MLISIVKFLSTGLPFKKLLTSALYTKMMLEACPTKCPMPLCKEKSEEDGRAFKSLFIESVFGNGVHKQSILSLKCQNITYHCSSTFKTSGGRERAIDSLRNVVL